MVNDADAIALVQPRQHNIMIRYANKKETGMAVELLNVKGLSELDQAAPVVMLNLMRFRERSLDGDGSGWDAYLRYSALTVPMIKARGGTLLWTGNALAVALGAEQG
jgi:hypothetical protein